MNSLKLRLAAVALLASAAVLPARAQTATPSSPTPTPAPSGPVILRVNGEEVKQSQLDDLVNEMMKDQMQQLMMSGGDHSQLTPDILAKFQDAIKSQAKDQLIDVTVYNQAIKKITPAVKDADVRARMDEIDGQLKATGGTNLEAAAKEKGQTLDDVKQNIRRELAAEQLLKDNKVTVDPTDADIKKFYDDHKDQISQPEMRLSHILIAFPKVAAPPPSIPGMPPPAMPTPDPKVKADLKKKADDVYAKVKAGGDFAALATQYSDHKDTADKGGDLGFMSKDDQGVPPEFNAAAWGLKADGDTTGVVESELGFHIIKRTGFRPPQSFDEQKAAMKSFLRTQNMRQNLGPLVDKMVKDAKVDDLMPTPVPTPAPAGTPLFPGTMQPGGMAAPTPKAK